MVKAIICDVKDCGTRIANLHEEEELVDKISIQKANDCFEEKYDLCKDCLERIESLIKGKEDTKVTKVTPEEKTPDPVEAMRSKDGTDEYAPQTDDRKASTPEDQDFQKPARKGRKTKAQENEEQMKELLTKGAIKKHNIWTAEEDEYILQNQEQKPKEIANKLQRTIASVYVRKSKLLKENGSEETKSTCSDTETN